MADRPGYLIGTGGPQGLWLGLGPGRLLVLGGGVAVAVLTVHAGLSPALGLLPAVVSAAWCLVPVAGATAHAWAGPASRHLATVVTGTHRWRVPLTAAPIRTGSPVPLLVPPELGRLRLLHETSRGLDIGVLYDATDRRCRLTAVLTTGVTPRFALADPVDQHRLLDRWADVLATLAAEHPGRHRITWVHRATPAATETHLHWMREHGAGGAPVAGYESFVSHVGDSAAELASYVGVQVDATSRDLTAASRQAADAARLAAARLLDAGVVSRPLGGDQLADLIAAWSTTTPPPRQSHPQTTGTAGAASRIATWDHLRTDDSYHRAFLVTGWPRVPVGPDWLRPLLHATPDVMARAVAVHFDHVPVHLAARRARAARISAELDLTDRTRFGLIVDARRERAQQEATSLDEELAAGHACHRIAAVVLVTAPSTHQLADASRQIVAAAATARLDLRPLHGQHHLGWAASLPLCRLRHRATP